MARVRHVVTVLIGAFVLVGCGVDEGAVRDLEGMPGVESASTLCTAGSCELSVTTAATISADQLAVVLAEARSIDAVSTEVGTEPVTLAFSGESHGGSSDRAAAVFALEAQQNTQIDNVRLNLIKNRTLAGLKVLGSTMDLLATAPQLWDDLQSLPNPALTVRNRPSAERATGQIIAAGRYPSAAADFVGELPQDLATTGVLIEGDRVIIGAAGTAEASLIDAAVADGGAPSQLDVEVVLAESVLRYSDDLAGEETQVRALVKVLEDLDGVTVGVDGRTVEVMAEVARRGDIVNAIRASREGLTASQKPGVDVTLGSTAHVRLGPNDSPELVELAGSVATLPGVLRSDIELPSPAANPVAPPADTEASIFVEVAGAGLPTAVQGVADRFARWTGDVDSFSVYVQDLDAGGPDASVLLRVDRRDGTWVPSTLNRGTPEQVRLGVRSWLAAAG